MSPRGELTNGVLRGLKQVSGLSVWKVSGPGETTWHCPVIGLPLVCGYCCRHPASASWSRLSQVPSAAAPAPASLSTHSVRAHCRDATTSPKDSKSPPILLPLETLSIMITSPLFLGPPLTRPRLQTLDTLHGTSDTRSRCGRFLWAPELALRAVEEGPEGQVSSLAAGTRISSCPCPLCFTLRSRDPPPGSHSSPALLPGSMLQRFTRPGHLPAQDPEQGGSSTCHLQIVYYCNCPGREGRTGRDPAAQRPSHAGRLDKHSGPEGHSASRSQSWPAPPRPHAGVTDWALPQGPTRVLEALQGL